MNKLPKEKRDRIILIGMGALMVIIGLWFGLISAQQKALKLVARQIADEIDKVEKGERLIKSGPKLQEHFEAVAQALKTKEDVMASGDLYSWFYKTLKNFQTNYRVEILDIKDQQLGDIKLLPNYPYKAVTFTVNMAGYYHDLGKFLADFENHFPYMRVQNVLIKQAENATPEEQEKLSCKMDIVLLRKQSSTSP